jgi:hypothetical protein
MAVQVAGAVALACSLAPDFMARAEDRAVGEASIAETGLSQVERPSADP